MNRKIFYLLFLLWQGTLSQAQICPGNQGSVQWECWRNLYEASFGELSAHEFYPSRPDIVKTLYSLDAPRNYDNSFGARVAGFIKITQTDSVVFNITCNERGRFYLSTDDTPDNLQLVASTPSSTQISEHDRFPEQTSDTLLLVADQYYYFEMIYVDGSGSDHCRLHWKNNFLTPDTWHIITAQYLYNVDCLPDSCPARGTPCDDGDPATSDDVEDGHCHCVGQDTTSNSCVGPKGFIERFRYDNITGSTLNDLYASSSYPGLPDYSASMQVMGIAPSSQINNTGHLVSAYLSVPVSGNYKFNITGDDQTAFFLSNNDDPANKQSTQAIVLGWTNATEHDKYIFQSTGLVYLEAGQYYYMEINHKEGTGSEHFGLFWQTPFTPAGVWKRIPSFYFFDYDCDIACIPEGVPCDDGNPFTNNDQYNANCECTGVPCSGEDCDSPLANYTPYEKCGLTDQIDNRTESSWLSCAASDNPNSARDRSHWIMYDLGERYQLHTSQVWNYNASGQQNLGFENVVVDYSENGSDWVNLGQYTWPQASGENGYGGFNGPHFDGVYAQYILITSLDDTLSCRGISKMAFQAVLCPLAGTVCDDGDDQTLEDKYNGNCECAGINLAVNPCEEPVMLLQDTSLNTYVYGAELSISTQNGVEVHEVTGLVAGDFIELNPGFETFYSSVFMASVGPCMGSSMRFGTVSEDDKNEFSQKPENDDEPYLFARKIENTDFLDIYFKLDEKSHPVLILTDMNQGVNYFLADYELLNKGIYRKRIRTIKLENLKECVLRYKINGKTYELENLE